MFRKFYIFAQVLFGDWTPADDEGVHSSYKDAMGLLSQGHAGYKLHLANRIYAHQPTMGDLLSEFTNLLKEMYESELQLVDFGESEKTRKLIND